MIEAEPIVFAVDDDPSVRRSMERLIQTHIMQKMRAGSLADLIKMAQKLGLTGEP